MIKYVIPQKLNFMIEMPKHSQCLIAGIDVCGSEMLWVKHSRSEEIEERWFVRKEVRGDINLNDFIGVYNRGDQTLGVMEVI